MERLHLKRNLVLSAAKANEEPKTSKLTTATCTTAVGQAALNSYVRVK